MWNWLLEDTKVANSGEIHENILSQTLLNVSTVNALICATTHEFFSVSTIHTLIFLSRDDYTSSQ